MKNNLRYFEVRNGRLDIEVRYLGVLIFKYSKHQRFNFKNIPLPTSKILASHFSLPTSRNPNQTGITALAALTILGLFLAVSLALVGTGTVKLPWDAQIPVSPIPISDPVEDDEACNDPANADCEPFIYNDPEDLSPEQIQKALEEG